MRTRIIGLGAAGNKAAIAVIEKSILSKEEVLLFNSTIKDVPDAWRSIAIQFTNVSRGGCGKERQAGKDLCLEFLGSERVKQLDSFIQDGEDNLIIIVSSSEGGTGSGSSAIMAQYIKDVLGANVMPFVFDGFEEDSRGLQNTIEYFKDMQDKYIIQAISNKKFLDGPNKFKAEKAANDEFARRVSIINGSMLIDSDQNIDETDLYKVVTTAGFMTVGYTELNKIKNIAQFNTVLTECIDNDKSLDISTKSAKRIAVIINAKEETKDSIDFSFSVLKEKFGSPYEIFTHAQFDESQPEYVAFIVSGLELPIDDVQEVYEKYKKESEKVSKRKDGFFEAASKLKGNEIDAMFNLEVPSKEVTTDRSKFLNTFKKNIKTETVPNKEIDASITDVKNNQFITKY